MDCKLIAFDLDGTLLDNAKRLPEENLHALCLAAERGVHIVPATGRILRGIPEELKALPFIRYYILSNGAVVYDTQEEKTLYRGDIPLDLALHVMDHLDTLPVIYDCYQNDVGWISQSAYEQVPVYFAREPEIRKLVDKLRIRVPDLKATLREHGEPLQKIQFYFKPEDNALRLETIAHFSELFPEICATTSVSNNVELNSVRAGRGVAMANAGEDVKAAADAVCESNEDCGVAREIYRVLGV